MEFLSDYRWQRLKDILEKRCQWALAFSGGKDSSILLWFTHWFTRTKMLPIFVEHELLPSDAKEQAFRILELLKVPLTPWVVPCQVLNTEDVRKNDKNRCYYCKRLIMGTVIGQARTFGCDGICDGTVRDDEYGFRPGIEALRELDVMSPFSMAGIGTEDIVRVMSEYLNVPSSMFRSESCLATRVPYDTTINKSLLKRIDILEQIVKSACSGPVRARFHPQDNLVRIEVLPDELPAILDKKWRKNLVHTANLLGFRFITFDILGFRSGSWDEILE